MKLGKALDRFRPKDAGSRAVWPDGGEDFAGKEKQVGHVGEEPGVLLTESDKNCAGQRREIDDECIRRSDIYFVHSKEVARNDQSPDVWEAAQKGIKRWQDIGELQDLVAGKLPGRTSADQITLFNNNTGAGTQFAAVGSAVLKRAPVDAATWRDYLDFCAMPSDAVVPADIRRNAAWLVDALRHPDDLSRLSGEVKDCAAAFPVPGLVR